MHLTSDEVNVIEILPGGVVTKKAAAHIQLDENGEFVRNPKEDLVKVAVVERASGNRQCSLRILKRIWNQRGCCGTVCCA